MHGILANNTITEKEINNLSDWLDINEYLKKTYPYDEIYSLVTSVLIDKKIDDNEKSILKVYFSEYIDLENSYNINQKEIEELKNKIKIEGICATCPNITFENKTFCFTGVSEKATRKEIAKIIQDLGGIHNKSVILKTNYLIVGNNGNPCWTYACYGRKIEKAMQLRKEGRKIMIINENDFWDAIADFS